MAFSKILCILVSLFIFFEGLLFSTSPNFLKKALEETPSFVIKTLGFIEAILGLIILFLLSRNL